MITVRYQTQAARMPLKRDFNFNGGEVQIAVQCGLGHDTEIIVDARLHNSDDIMKLCMVKDALDRVYPNHDKWLHMPYVPYARQDRVMEPGESLSIKVFANIINALNFKRVSTLDNHSAVATALIDRCEDHSVLDVLWEIPRLNQRLLAEDSPYVLVCPDAGAMKKTLKIAQHYGGLKIIQCDKERDTKTGKILRTVVHWPQFDLGGKRLLIVDDICDGGMTFIKIAEAFFERYSSVILELLVSHGIFSKGFPPLLDSGISHIYTTDSFPQESHPLIKKFLTVVPL